MLCKVAEPIHIGSNLVWYGVSIEWIGMNLATPPPQLKGDRGVDIELG